MRNFGDPTRYEKEITTEPNKVGEMAPALGTQTTGWDSLKNEPFRGNQNAFSKATARQGDAPVMQSNAFSKAAPNSNKQNTEKSNILLLQHSK